MSLDEKIAKKFFGGKKEKIDKVDKKQLRLDTVYKTPNDLILNDNNFQEKLRLDDIKNLIIDQHPNYALKEQIPLDNDEESTLFSKKETIILKSIIAFNKDNNKPNIKYFQKRELNYSKNNNESNIQIEIYTNINLIINSLLDNENNDSNNSEVFLIIFNKYNEMKKICQNIEKDFNLIFDKIKKEVDIDFTLIELFTDLFWDFIFKIQQINCIFSEVYIKDNIDKKIKNIIDEIINLLFSIKIPLKKKNWRIIKYFMDIKRRNFFIIIYNKIKK